MKSNVYNGFVGEYIDFYATGIQIKDLMKREKISVQELSNIMKISFQAIYRWQEGKAMPSVYNLFILGQILNSKIENILVIKEK